MALSKYYNSFVKWASKASDSTCLLCNLPSNGRICHCCYGDIPFFDAAAVPTNLLHYPLIRRHLHKPRYHVLRAMGWYAWPFDELILNSKLKHSLPSINALASMYCQFHHTHPAPLPDVLLPVPISIFTLWQRQYNQANELAKLIGQSLGIPVHSTWATRAWHKSQSQRLLTKQARLNNVSHAYSVNRLPQGISSVAIVDDVITTGATVNALCRQLKQQRPNLNVQVWAMAVTSIKRRR